MDSANVHLYCKNYIHVSSMEKCVPDVDEYIIPQLFLNCRIMSDLYCTFTYFQCNVHVKSMEYPLPRSVKMSLAENCLNIKYSEDVQW